MRKTIASAVLGCLALATVLGCRPVVVQQNRPDRHPAYLRALADLRDARAQLERRRGDALARWDERNAIREIELAIHEIKEASIEDGKRLEDHAPVDVRMEYGGRLHRAIELLRKAERDCREDVDNGYARGLQRRAIEHIHAAIRRTEDGIGDSRR